MVNRSVMVKALDAEFSFFCGSDKSKNGLQVKGTRELRKVAVSCDAALETIHKAVRLGADMLIVHHGLRWVGQGPLRSEPLLHARLQAAKDADLNVYAQHLPLDAHPVLGNNVLLAQALGLRNVVSACPHDGAKIAFKGSLERAVSVRAFSALVARRVGASYRTLAFGPASVRKVAVCSGAAGSFTSFAQAERFDTLVTGEFKHSDYHAAKEYGVNVIEAGHYNTEVWGVQAVGRWIEGKFGVPTVFNDAPTGF